MKIIVTYASAGKGHFRAAEAIYDYIRENRPDIDIKLIDILEKTNALFKSSYIFGYSLLIKQLPLLWQWGFWLTNLRPLRLFTGLIAYTFNRLNSEKFVEFLIQENPDFIISTHFFPSEICATVKKAKKIKSKLVTIITDFIVHPFWISKVIDIYIVASEFTKKQLLLEGIKENSIREFGIPIHSKFLKQYDRAKICKKFGLDENRFTILIMTGSFGLGPLGEIVRALYSEVQILVICGINKKLYTRLKNRNLSYVKVFGFVDNMQELMAVTDIIITKPGGVTISEILNMELVPLFISPIPGQETGNVEVLKKYGIGLSPKNIQDIKNMVLDFRDHLDKLECVKVNIKKIKKSDCLSKIYDVICQGSAGFTC